MKKEPAKFPENTLKDFDKPINLQDVMRKTIFDYLKESLTIGVDCRKNWGYYENGDVVVTVNLFLKNPETDKVETIASSSDTAY